MEMNRTAWLLGLFATTSIAAQVSLNFETFSFDAELKENFTPANEVASCLDGFDRTHIAWIKAEAGTTTELMYSRYDKNSGLMTVQITSNTGNEFFPSITVDTSGNPHITYFIERDPNNCDYTFSRSGNWAVMYAGDSDGDATFEIEQVSTNLNDACDNSEDVFHTYFRSRPQISLDGSNTVFINYVSMVAPTATSNRYIILASRTGAIWNREAIFAPENNYSTSRAFALPLRMTPFKHMAWIDISNYEPSFGLEIDGTWCEGTIVGFAGIFNNDNAQIEIDDSGQVHYMWHNDDSSGFFHTTLNGDNNSDIHFAPTQFTAGGSYIPATVDFATGDKYYCYGRSYRNEIYLISFNDDGNPVETIIEDVVGFLGPQGLYVRNGYISIVNASSSRDKIYISTNTGTAVGVDEQIQMPENFSLLQNYPNPFNPGTALRFELPQTAVVNLVVYNLMGRQIVRLVNDRLEAGYHQVNWNGKAANGQELPTGIYIAHLVTPAYTKSIKLLLLK